MSRSPFTVGQVAAMTHLTVRALHHYDAIGLVSPSCRSAAGYRLYADDDLYRLQQVLLFRELGFALEDVRTLLDASPQRKRDALLAQRQVLLGKRAHAEAELEAVDATLLTLESNEPMNTETLFEGYEHFANGEYAEEAEREWGHSESWRTSHRRTKDYSKEDWAKLQAESDAINADFVVAMQQNLTTDSLEVRALAERHRMHIDRWFYPCSPAMHVNVAAHYTHDPRFQAHYDRLAPGLAVYIQSAIHSNAQSHNTTNDANEKNV